MIGRTLVATLLGCGSLFCGAMAWSLSHTLPPSLAHQIPDHHKIGTDAKRPA